MFLLVASYTSGEETPIKLFETKEQAEKYVENCENHCCKYHSTNREHFSEGRGYRIWNVGNPTTDTTAQCEPVKYKYKKIKKKGFPVRVEMTKEDDIELNKKHTYCSNVRMNGECRNCKVILDDEIEHNLSDSD